MNPATTISKNVTNKWHDLSITDRWCRRLVLRLLTRLNEGRLTLVEGSDRFVFGRRTEACDVDVTVTVLTPRFYRTVALGGSVAAGEAYADGLWACDDLPGLIRIFVRAQEALDATDSGWARMTAPLRTAFQWMRRNTKRGSRRNIYEHYDLGNDFFSLFLDPTMSYSCAIFEDPGVTLEEASIAKNDRICKKLRLSPGDRAIEIGTGWGGFAIHVAQHYGCHVTTTTISRQQYELAAKRVREAGLEKQVTLLERDYRDLDGRFDKLVSIEMIEAVGHQYYDEFFRKCRDLLKPDGLMLLQAITIADHRYEQARRNVDFIKRHIFPGSCIPSVTRIGKAIADCTDLRMVHLEDLTPHYATTLRHWRENLLRNIEDIRRLGYPDRFLRLWEYYLAYCEGGFAERYIGDVQIMFARPHCRLAPVLPPLPSRLEGAVA